MKKLHYIFIPLILTLLSFFINQPCTGMWCVFSGNGFPIGYYNDSRGLYLPFFISDYFFFALAWFIGFKTVRHFVRQKHHETPEFTRESL